MIFHPNQPQPPLVAPQAPAATAPPRPSVPPVVGPDEEVELSTLLPSMDQVRKALRGGVNG